MTGAESFKKGGKCKNIRCSSMSSSAWCALNSKDDILKLHDKCPNPKCGCRKILAFTPHRYMLERGSIKSKLKSIFKRTKKAWDNFIKPCLIMTTPLISAAVAARAKNSQSPQVTNSISKFLQEVKF